MANNAASYNTPPTCSPSCASRCLASIPVIGPMLFDQNIVVYLAYMLVIVV